MKKSLLTLFLSLLVIPLIGNVQLLKSDYQKPEAVTIGYVILADAITDFNEIVKKLKTLAEDPAIDIIVLNINSPGGSPGSSQIIADFILWIRQIKPVLCFISDTGSSGAYWIAAACTKIIAPESALIGSIGVAHELPKKNKNISFTAGKYKRTQYLADGVINEDHKEKIQERLEIMYTLFCRSIAALRSLSLETVKNLEAQVFLGVQALELGLIDQTGTIRDVFEAALELTRDKKSTPATMIRLITSPTDILEFAL